MKNSVAFSSQSAISLKTGSSLLKPHRKISPDILSILPRSMLCKDSALPVYSELVLTSLSVPPRGKMGIQGTFDNDNNSIHDYYYVPELRIVLNRYEELRSSPADLDAFVALQKMLASQMIKVWLL